MLLKNTDTTFIFSHSFIVIINFYVYFKEWILLFKGEKILTMLIIKVKLFSDEPILLLEFDSKI